MKSETNEEQGKQNSILLRICWIDKYSKVKKSPRAESGRIYQCKTKPGIQEHQEV